MQGFFGFSPDGLIVMTFIALVCILAGTSVLVAVTVATGFFAVKSLIGMAS